MILQVRHAMGGHPYTVPHDAKVTDVARMMITAGINTIIVTRDHEILGSVTVNDILRHTYKPGFNPNEETIGSITDEDIMLARPTTSLSDVRAILTESNVDALPVVDRELVGYITLRDLLKVQPEQIAQAREVS
jgi:CBS domain-containing protein